MNSQTNFFERFASGVFLAMFFFLINLRSFVFWTLYPSTTLFTGVAWLEVVLWFPVLFSAAYLLFKQQDVSKFWSSIQKKTFIIVFVVFSMASILWSSSQSVTFHRASIFVFATISAFVVGSRYSLDGFLRILFRLGVVMVGLSCLFIAVVPHLGTDLNPPYNGAWRGLFWHKNHLGNLLPLFSVVFLLGFADSLAQKNKPGILSAAVVYAVSMFMLMKTDSAAGYILAVILHLCLLVSWLWIKFSARLKSVHYLILAGVSFLVLASVLFNLDFVFGLFNRTPTLTGRLPLWSHLLQTSVAQSPWVGHGFGTVWAELSFRLATQEVVQWGYPVMIGDNGFLDILLNLGVAGLVMFLAVYLRESVRWVAQFIEKRRLLFSFPLIFSIYVFFANLSFSLLMETELLIWTTFVILASIRSGRTEVG